jgi:hypothetical protein
MQKGDSKMIRISNKTYTDLAKRGTVTDTFDTVIQDLLTSKTVTAKKQMEHSE